MQTLTTEQELIVSTVRKFVAKEVIPVASALEHRNEYPHTLVGQMKEMGLFGLNIPEDYGGAGVDTTTFAMIFEEISKGWLGLAGVIGSHSVMCDVVVRFGSEEQKRRFLPGMASGEKRGGICLTESNAGTDLQNIRTTATRDGDVYRINGSKMWITNARHGVAFLLLAKTDSSAQPAHRGMSAFIIEKGAPGLTVGRDIDKLGYKSVETCELYFDNFAVPVENLGRRHRGSGLQTSDDGPRGRAPERSGARAGRGSRSLRGGDSLCPAPGYFRQGYRGIPNHPEQIGRYGDQN